MDDEFNPKYDDNKVEDVIYFRKAKSDNNKKFRKVEMFISDDSNFLTEKNKIERTNGIKFEIKDEIVLYKTPEGQQKYSCWLIEEEGKRYITALHIARRLGNKKTYSNNEICLNPSAVAKLKIFLDTIFTIKLEDFNFKKHFNKSNENVIIKKQDFIKNILIDENKSKFIDELIKNKLNPKIITEFINTNKENLNILQMIRQLDEDSSEKIYDNIKLEKLKLDVIEKNLNNNKESFWQNFFIKNPIILSTLIPSVMQIICEQPFLGGKNILNKGGVLSDFLYKSGFSNLSIIEIKTPYQKLVNKTELREGVYSISADLTAAIVQLKKQKDKFLKSYFQIRDESRSQGIEIQAIDPKCYLLIGNTTELSKIQKESFELFRNELKDIEIITFNELLEKLKLIVSYLEK